MIYLKDDATGVTVEQTHLGDIKLSTADTGHLYAKTAEAEALLRGLLRWKLESGGLSAAVDVTDGTIAEWLGIATLLRSLAAVAPLVVKRGVK